MLNSITLLEDKPLEKYTLPKLLIIVRVKKNFNQSLISLPSSVKVIVFDCSHILPYDTIPLGIEKIFISLTNIKTLTISNLPSSLEQIIIKDLYTGGYFNEETKKLKYEKITEKILKLPLGCQVTDMCNEDFTHFFK